MWGLVASLAGTFRLVLCLLPTSGLRVMTSQKAPAGEASVGSDGFFRAGSRQPVRPFTRQLTDMFSLELGQRGVRWCDNTEYENSHILVGIRVTCAPGCTPHPKFGVVPRIPHSTKNKTCFHLCAL